MASCIGCGCTEIHACIDTRTGRGCAWVRGDGAGHGVCSQCRELVASWDAGERGRLRCPACARPLELSAGALARVVHQVGAVECPGCELTLGVVFAAGDRASWASEWGELGRVVLVAASARVLAQHMLMRGLIPQGLPS